MASGVQEAEFPSEIKQVLMMEKAGESSRKSQSPLNDRHSWLVLILIIEDGDVEKARQSHRNKCRHSWLVPMLMVANLAMFCSAMYMNNCPQHFPLCERKCVGSFLGRFSFEPLSHNPLFGPSSTTLKKMGAIEWEKVVIQNQEWRLISCIWLHAGIIHLFVDMLSLFFIGIRLEQHFGFVRVGSIYLLSGLAGSVVSTVFVGASGALFGLLGADLAQIVTNWQLCTNKAAALCTLLIYIAINLAIGILPHVDNFCNIGGFIAGLLLGFLLLPLPPDGWFDFPDYVGGARVAFKYKYQLHQYVLCLVSVVLLVLGFTLALVMLFRGVNGSDGCHWCHYLECVPTSIWNCSESDSSNNCGWMLRLIIEWLLESRAELGPNFDQISFESGFIEILRALTKSTLVPELHFCIQKYLNLK